MGFEEITCAIDLIACTTTFTVPVMATTLSVDSGQHWVKILNDAFVSSRSSFILSPPRPMIPPACEVWTNILSSISLSSECFYFKRTIRPSTLVIQLTSSNKYLITSFTMSTRLSLLVEMVRTLCDEVDRMKNKRNKWFIKCKGATTQKEIPFRSIAVGNDDSRLELVDDGESSKRQRRSQHKSR